ncbi:MAG: PAS domain-containing protein, partial [Myxococcales bacterium]|nr:PAS domain-containing protein [Myxococcales bacterium]
MTFAFNIVDGENLVALSRDLLAICGPDASMRQVNASWSEQLGHTREALLSRPIFAFVHPEDRGELIEKLNRMLSDTDRADGFTRLVTTNGACVACSWRGRSSKRTQQLYLAFTPAGSAPDIDRWLRTISTESHEWLLCLDESGRIHLSAGGSQTLVGAPPEAAVGATLLELVADEDCERVARALKQAVRREGEPQELAYRHNHSNGGGVPVLAAITSRLLDAAVGRVVVILRRPNSPQQRDTAEWRERFALAAQGTTDGIWEWDLVAGSCFYSPRWKEILGLQDDAVSDKPEEWLDRVHPADRDRLNESLTHYFEGRTPHLEIEHRIRHKNGQYLWVRCRGKALRQNGG